MEKSPSPSIVGTRVYRDENGVSAHIAVESGGVRQVVVVEVDRSLVGKISLEHVRSALAKPSQVWGEN